MDISPALNLHPAAWIWDVRLTTPHSWLAVEHEVDLTASQLAGATLLITASTLYALHINGEPLAHGPAKSAKGRISVDCLALTTHLRPGRNLIAICVHHVGLGTMTWCSETPGVLFRLDAADGSVLAASGPATRVRPDPQHARATVRRWAMPCIEDVEVDGAARADAPAWAAPEIRTLEQVAYARRVPLASRRRRLPTRLVEMQTVDQTALILSQRLKPYLVTAEEEQRFNPYGTAAMLITEIDSPLAQDLHFLPALGAATWFIGDAKVAESNGWGHDGMWQVPAVAIPAGRTRLIGLHRHNHFEDLTLALRGSQAPLTAACNPYGTGWLQVIRLPGSSSPATPAGLDPDALRAAMPEMHAADAGDDRNAFVRMMNARVLTRQAAPFTPGDSLRFPAAPAGLATRVILDFGWVLNGHLALTLTSTAGGRLSAAWTEYADVDAVSGVRLQWPNCNNAVTIRTSGGTQAVEGFYAHGGRYLVLDWEGSTPVQLDGVSMLDANCGSAEVGTLDTDRPLHGEIWDLCRQSVISGVDDTFTDCPTFEQVGWNFDNRTAWMGERWLCANTAVAANSMQLFAEDPEYTGLTRSQYPSAWDNSIPLWSFHWILWVRDWWWHSGDATATRLLMPRIAAGLAEALAKRDADGLMAWDGVWHFVEWGDGRDDAQLVNTAEQAGLWASLQAAEELAAGLGMMAAEAVTWHAARLSLGEAIERHLWVPERQAWADSRRVDGTPSPVSSQVTNAWLAALGLGGAVRAQQMAQRILANDAALTAYGSPLGLWYILDLYCRTGQRAAALSLIEQRWGEMLASGDRTTWETFPEYGLKHGPWATRSRCHPFAAYAAGMLVDLLTGIEVLAPGCARIRVRSDAPNNVGRCEVCLPTPQGLLKIAWRRREDGTYDTSVDAPSGMTVETIDG